MGCSCALFAQASALGVGGFGFWKLTFELETTFAACGQSARLQPCV